MKYISPEMEVVKFSNADIIVCSSSEALPIITEPTFDTSDFSDGGSF